jgi:Uncharacterized alpha/beta hydrolase domain (DUF2235)
MKNLVLCCDGTANDRTNVIKLFSVLIQDPNQQAVYYHPGLGTMEPPGALTPIAQRVTRLLGRAFGYGLEADVRDAYAFLVRHFEAGDRVFLFGFSRGAYTVRTMAALLYLYGLIPNGNEPLVPYTIRMMTAINEAEENADKRPYFALAGELRKRSAGCGFASPASSASGTLSAQLAGMRTRCGYRTPRILISRLAVTRSLSTSAAHSFVPIFGGGGINRPKADRRI